MAPAWGRQYVLGEGGTRLRRHDATPDPREQVDAEGALQLAHLLGHRGLGHPERPRRSREGPELRRCGEATDLLKRQKVSFGLLQGAKPTLRLSSAA